ncbi:methionine aminopeptidase 1c, putative [Plasmodium vinckei lentum]|uniref:Methionine aminopeptidase 1c, putative n=1 Tax=Plasmodium vinckei lentum TaxID=138297 RepID=A0A6V7SI49_PLAVN|nr:methionine aminopeptidase 1c, putative [Plasmodium vinckei lentum]
MNVHIFLLLLFCGTFLCKKNSNNGNFRIIHQNGTRGNRKRNVKCVREKKQYNYIHPNEISKNKNDIRYHHYNFLINTCTQKKKLLAKKEKSKRQYNLNSSGEGFSNTVHTNVKKNTNDYSEEQLPTYHKYIENFKTRKIIHPSIRITDHDKKFMKCKESYNKLYSHLTETELFENFSYVGRQRKGILSPKYYLPKYIERPNYHKTGTPIYVNYENNSKSKGYISMRNSNNETENGHKTYSTTNKYEYDNVKTDHDIEMISRNCKFARELMDDISYIICEGITTNDIDIYILNKCVNNGFYPSPLNYHLFPKSSCISINEILCHGIPDNNVLYENDVVKVDISVYKDGYHADMCESFIVQKISKAEKKKRKKNYDYIYLNDKLRTKHTKYIIKYNFDLTTNKIVKKGKYPSVRKVRYNPPNSKEHENEYIEEYDDNTNPVLGESPYAHNYYTYNDGPNNVSENYEDELENFHRRYDEDFIFNPKKGEVYNNLQQYIYQKGMETDKNRKEMNRKFEFFDTSKQGIANMKKFMFEKNRDLIKTAYDCTMEAISICKPGVPFKNIAKVMDDYLKKKNNSYQYYSIVPNLCGHNIGKNFHEEPFIIHTLNDDDRKMCENLVFTIEPIITERSCDFITWPDNWTLSNSRYYYSAQFEHTILITKNGAKILTQKTETSPKYIWEDDGN